MRRQITVNLGNLVLSLSDAMDLASPLLIQHQQRTGFIVWQIGKAGGLSNESLERCFMAALLHDIGAFSLGEKISFQTFEVENVEKHCICGCMLLSKIPWLKDAAKIIRFHHKQWQDWHESIENPLVFESQLISLADYVERQINRDQYVLHQHENIISTTKSLSGSLFHSRVVDLFLANSEREEFWLDLVSPRLYSLLLHEGPFKKMEIDFPDILLISELFRNIIDFRSRFTSTHSSGVIACAAMLSKAFGFTGTEVGLMQVAGNLHDLGKLAIPSSILDKPGKLTHEEMAIMKSHPYHTYSVINTIGGLRQIAEWAAYHHERLDGSGYPFRCNEAEISTGARIMMVADIFTALAEDRPYRKGMSRKEIVRILKGFSNSRLLDTRIVNLLFENYDEVYTYVAEKQALSKEFYEKQICSVH